MNLPLSGAPGDRENRLLLALLNNRQRLLRYLLLLLAEADLDPCQVLGQCEGTGDRGNGETRDTSFGLPLLEPLMRALDRDPHRLVHIARLVDDLQATEDGRKIVPAEFMAIWEPIWRASKEQADAKS